MKKKMFFVVAACALFTSVALTSCEDEDKTCTCTVTSDYYSTSITQQITPSSIGVTSCSAVQRTMNKTSDETGAGLNYSCK